MDGERFELQKNIESRSSPPNEAPGLNLDDWRVLFHALAGGDGVISLKEIFSPPVQSKRNEQVPMLAALRLHFGEIMSLSPDNRAGITERDLSVLIDCLKFRRQALGELDLMERFSPQLFAMLDLNHNRRLTHEELDGLIVPHRGAPALRHVQEKLRANYAAMEHPRLFGLWRPGISIEDIARASRHWRNNDNRLNRLCDSVEHIARNIGDSHWNGASIQPRIPQSRDINSFSVIQGNSSNCSFLAALSALAHSRPRTIAQMFALNESGQVCVTFQGAPNHSIVPKLLPAEHNRFARPSNGNWSATLEMAYEKVENETGFARRRAGVRLDRGIFLLTGHGSQIYRFGYSGLIYPDGPGLLSSGNELEQAIESATREKRIATAVISSKEDPDLQNNHVYSILNYDKSTRMLVIRNPYGRGEPRNPWGRAKDGRDDGVFRMSIREFTKRFDAIAIEQIRPIGVKQ